MKKFSLVIPAYNEEKNLTLLINRTLSSAQEAGFDENNFELVLVENGSTDNSIEVIEEFISKKNLKNYVQVVKIAKNQGYGFGVIEGLKKAKGEIVSWTHADLQCDPNNAFIAYKILLESKDRKILVKGSRVGRSAQERFTTNVFEIISRLILGISTKEINAQPKVFTRELLAHLNSPPSHFALDLYLIYKALQNGYKVNEFSVQFPARIHGVSHWASTTIGRYKTIFGIILYMLKLAKTEGRL